MVGTTQMTPYTRRVWIAVAVAALVFLGGWLVSHLVQGLLVIFAGVLWAVFIYHLTQLAVRYLGLRYEVAFAGVLLVFVALAAGTLIFMGHQITQRTSQFINQFEQASSSFQQRLADNPVVQRWQQMSQGQSSALSSRAVSTVTSTARSTISVTLAAGGGLIVVFFLGLYLAVQPEPYRRGVVRLFPPNQRDRVDQVLDKMGTSLWYWILGRLAGMLIIGVSTTIALWFIGIPMALTLGVLAAVLTFVPNFGPILAAVPPLLFALQKGSTTAFWVLGLYVAIQLIESYLITPLIDRHQVHLPPGVVLSSQLLFGLTAGLLGVVLATPLAVVLLIAIRDFYVKPIEQTG